MSDICRQGYEINPSNGRCVKKCKEGFERNPVTGRCKKIPVLKFCKQGYERNPLTGRCIKICKNDSERNPKTKRCIKKCKSHLKRNPLTGRCKKITKEKTPIYYHPYVCDIDDKKLKEVFEHENIFPRKFATYVEKNRLERESNCQTLTKHFPKQYVHKLTGLLGAGDFGFVFENTEPDGEKLALKVSIIDQENNEDKLNKEMIITDRFVNLGMAMPIKSFGTAHIKNSGIALHSFIKMEKVDGTVFHLLFRGFPDHPRKIREKSEIYDLVSKIYGVLLTMYENRLSHGDLHLHNIGYIIDSDGKLQIKLIDFGESRISKSMSKNRLGNDIEKLWHHIWESVDNNSWPIFNFIFKYYGKKYFGWRQTYYDHPDEDDENYEEEEDEDEDPIIPLPLSPQYDPYADDSDSPRSPQYDPYADAHGHF